MGADTRIQDTDHFFRLETEFPHITVQIAAMWGRQECQKYLMSLMLDTRDGARQGFPYAAFKDIMYFIIRHDEEYPEFAPKMEMWIAGNKIR